MRKFTKVLLGAVLWSAFLLPVQAEKLLQDPSGFNVRVADGYQVQQDASGIVLGGTGQPGVVVLKNHAFANFEAFASQANLARDGFEQVGEVRALNATDRHFRAAKPNPEGGYLIADTFVRFSPYGGGCVVVALSSSEQADAAYRWGEQVANQVAFSQPSVNNVWEQALRGKHLVYLSTGNGYSERFDLYLLANNTFVSRSDMSSLSMNGSGAAANRVDGSWRITPDGQLVLNYQNGQANTYQLQTRQASNEVALNGRRYFVLSE